MIRRRRQDVKEGLDERLAAPATERRTTGIQQHARLAHAWHTLSVSVLDTRHRNSTAALREARCQEMFDDNIPSRKYGDVGMPRYNVMSSVITVTSSKIARISRRTNKFSYVRHSFSRISTLYSISFKFQQKHLLLPHQALQPLYCVSKTKSPNKKILLSSVLCSFKFSIITV